MQLVCRAGECKGREWGECSVRECWGRVGSAVWESVGRRVWGESVGECSVREYSVGEYSVGECSVGECRGRVFVRLKASVLVSRPHCSFPQPAVRVWGSEQKGMAAT